MKKKLTTTHVLSFEYFSGNAKLLSLSPRFLLSVCGCRRISMCFEIIKRIDAENPNWEDEDSEQVKIIDNSIGILHNISRRLRDRELFGNREQTFLYFAKKEVPAIAAESLLTALAYLVDENTNHLILADENLLSIIITLLDEAWQSEDRHSNGYSAKKLAEGLATWPSMGLRGKLFLN